MARAKTASAEAHILEANEEIRELKMRIEEEKEKQKQRRKDIKTLQDEIIKQKKRQKGANGTHERHAQF